MYRVNNLGTLFLTIFSMNIHFNFSFCLLKGQHYENQGIGENILYGIFLTITFHHTSYVFFHNSKFVFLNTKSQHNKTEQLQERNQISS